MEVWRAELPEMQAEELLMEILRRRTIKMRVAVPAPMAATAGKAGTAGTPISQAAESAAPHFQVA